jgi:hypothetical protein
MPAGAKSARLCLAERSLPRTQVPIRLRRRRAEAVVGDVIDDRSDITADVADAALVVRERDSPSTITQQSKRQHRPHPDHR